MTHKVFPVAVGLAFAGLLMILLVPVGTLVHAQQLPAPGDTLTAGQLDDLVAPIALYPDPLVSQILVAATYPLEVVEASQWQLRNPSLSGLALTQAAEQQAWDPSVQALVAFPDVLKYLTEDIAWTTSLGNAFLAQETDVMDAIQRMRASAAASGKLTSNAQQQVTRTSDAGQPVYVIVPTNPDIIYVPAYDPFWVWGDPFYYPYARWYYPRTSGFYFGRGISFQLSFGSGWQGWSNWGWRPAWTSHNVIVNNTFVYRRNAGSTFVTNRTGSTTWSHDIAHRQGVPYPSSALTQRYQTGSRNYSRPQELTGRDRSPAMPSARGSSVAPVQSPRVPSNRNAWTGNSVGNSTGYSNRYSGASNGYVNPSPRRYDSTPGTTSRSVAPTTRRADRPSQPNMREQQHFRSSSAQSAPAMQQAPAHVAPQGRSAPSSQSTHASSHEQASSRGSGNGEKSRGRR